MARDADALKIQKWAATGDVQDPEDGGLLRSTGWDATYSQPGGNLPKREHINQLFRELSAQSVEVNVHGGGLEWDSSISYEHPAMVMGSDARPYVSVQNSVGADPTSDIINSHWALLESQGPVGPVGPPGTAGSDATAIQFGTAANRPAAAAANIGTLYFATDDKILSYHNGVAWVNVTRKIIVPFIIDGGEAEITTGEKGHLTIPQAGTITGWTLIADQIGSIVIDLWADSYANIPPTVADTITGTQKPTLSSVQNNQDLALGSWTTAVAKGDVWAYNVDSVTTVQRVYLGIEMEIE